MTIPELIEHIKNGRSIGVTRGSDGNRSLVISGSGSRGQSTRIALPPGTYDRLMFELVHALASRHGGDLTIDVKIDYYGAQWVEIRSGILTRRTARLGISPRYIALLQDLMAGRTRASEPA